MQIFNRSCNTILISPLARRRTLSLGLLLQGKPALEQVVLRRVFDCRLRTKHAINITRTFSHRKEFNSLDSTASYTLQSRILNYFRTNKKYNRTKAGRPNSESSSIDLEENIPSKPLERQLKCLPALNQRQLAQYICDLGLELPNLSMNKKQLLNLLSFTDKECCYRLKFMSRKEVLTVLDAWMHILPHKITHLNFYNLGIQQMEEWLSDPDILVEDFVQIVFYCGLLKKSLKGKQIMQLVLNIIDKNINLRLLSIEELCIMTNAIFKTATKIKSSNLLTAINIVIYQNLDTLLADPALFITLVKALRHAQNYDLKLLDTISYQMLSKNATQHLTFTAKAHLLALYAGALYARRDILSFLVESCKNDLILAASQIPVTRKSDHLSISHRSKDLSRFLWSVSYLNFPLEQEFIKSYIIPELRSRLECGEYLKTPNEIIDSLLSLWILGFKPETLLADTLSHHTLTTLKHENKLRFNSRLALLFTCVSIEASGILNTEQLSWKDAITKLSEPNFTRNLVTRPLLKKIYGIVSGLSTVLKLSNVSYKYIIPHLHIAGIEVNMESHTIYIEVLDPSVCLYKSHTPHGLMQLKLRLMNSLYYQFVIIDDHEIENLDESSSLYEYIEEKLITITKY